MSGESTRNGRTLRELPFPVAYFFAHQQLFSLPDGKNQVHCFPIAHWSAPNFLPSLSGARPVSLLEEQYPSIDRAASLAPTPVCQEHRLWTSLRSASANRKRCGSEPASSTVLPLSGTVYTSQPNLQQGQPSSSPCRLLCLALVNRARPRREPLFEPHLLHHLPKLAIIRVLWAPSHISPFLEVLTRVVTP